MNISFFDFETTGFGSYQSMGINPPGKLSSSNLSRSTPLIHDVGIYSVGMKTQSGILEEVYGKTDIPVESSLQAQNIFKANKASIMSSNNTERQMLAYFVTKLKENNTQVLAGHNIAQYDYPLLVKRLGQLGMQEESEYIKSLQVLDVLDTAKGFLNKVVEPYKHVLDINTGEYIKGANLESLAKGFGISYTPHIAKEDVRVTSRLYEIFSNPENAFKQFDITKWWQSVEDQNKRDGITFRRKGDELRKALALNPYRPEKFSTYSAAVPKSIQLTETQLAGAEKATEEAVTKQTKPFYQAVKDFVGSDDVRNTTTDTLERFFKGVDQFNAKYPNASKLAGLVAIGGGVVWGISKLPGILQTNDNIDRSGYIDAGTLGFTSMQMNKMLPGGPASFNAKANNSFKDSSDYNKALDMFKSLPGFRASNYPVYDDGLGVKGNIDVLMNMEGQNVPITLEAIDSKSLKDLQAPMRTSISKVNFFAHATQATGGYATYVSKDNPEITKSFWVQYNPGDLIADVNEFRGTLLSAGKRQNIASAWSSEYERLFDITPPIASRSQTIFNGSSYKIRDQATRNAHLFPIGTPRGGNYNVNGSHHLRRNDQ
jgi:hypothetical protein